MVAEIAHIVFAGGGLFLPARTPYDRQLLREHVRDTVHHKLQMQLNVDDRTWRVELPDDQRTAVCDRCGRPINHAACRRSDAPSGYCIACAVP